MSKYVDGIHEERFDKFLADLRSGEFKQGTGTLHRKRIDGSGEFGSQEETFCCLGVACYRAAEAGATQKFHENDDERYNLAYGDAWNSAELPQEVADYLGIPEHNRTYKSASTNIVFHRLGYREWEDDYDGDLTEDPSYLTAVGMNDTLGKSFAEIADAFEAEFKREV